MAAFQTLQLDKPGTDCGTDKCLKIFLTKKNIGLFHYRYTKSGDLITPETESRYIDRYVDIRSPLYCKTRCFCNKCAGELYYKIGIRNIGNTCNKISSTALNSSLKSFHDQTIKTVSFNYEDYFY